MHSYVALLRAVNLVGTRKVPMADLKMICEKAGFKSVKTYIASGNVVFQAGKTEAQVKATLEAALEKFVGRPVDVMVRTAAEMAAVLAANPFSDKPNPSTLACFLDDPPPADALEKVAGRINELVALGKREIYIYYADGVGESKLRMPAMKNGTARNMNTVAKLAEMAAAL